MKVSAKTEYACIAMLELAASYGTGEPVRIRSIAEDHDIPPRFLVQILLQLKGAGLVTSTRGAAGGYQLLKPPEEISLGEVMNVIEGREPPPDFTAAHSPTTKALLRTWHDITTAQQKLLRSITLADMVERIQGESETMFYI